MGNGSVFHRASTINEYIQVPSTAGTKRPSITSSRITPDPTFIDRRKSPISVAAEGFEVKTDAAQYASIWDNQVRLSSAFSKRLKAEFSKDEHHQNDLIENKWTENNKTEQDSAHVESSLTSEMHSCLNLSTSEKIDELITDLAQIHSQLDDTIRRRTQQISVETESVLAQIINETQQEQQRLLKYAKERQNQQENRYRNQLKVYISKLDDMKVKDLSQMQEELNQCREQILKVSQMKIMLVNEQANVAKSRVMKEEQQQASMKLNSINLQLKNLSKDKNFQQLGAESKSRTSLLVSSHVGTKLPDQRCQHEFTGNDRHDEGFFDQRKGHVRKKTIFPNIDNEEKVRSYQINQEIQRNTSNQIND